MRDGLSFAPRDFWGRANESRSELRWFAVTRIIFSLSKGTTIEVVYL